MINISLSINAKGERSLAITGVSTDFVDEHFPDFVNTLVERFHITEGLPTNSIDHSSEIYSSHSKPNANSKTTSRYMNKGDLCLKCNQGFMQIELAINKQTNSSYERLICGKACGFTAYISKYPTQTSNKPISTSSSIS